MKFYALATVSKRTGLSERHLKRVIRKHKVEVVQAGPHGSKYSVKTFVTEFGLEKIHELLDKGVVQPT